METARFSETRQTIDIYGVETRKNTLEKKF